MEQKINIAEILKNCEKGMELDCTMYDNCTFDGLEEYLYPIKVQTPDGRISLNKYGCYSSNKQAKCIIFPKGKTTWEGFVPPCSFDDGDIVATTDGFWIGITAGGKSGEFMPTYCVIKSNGEFEVYLDKKETWQFHRLATTWEKEKLFDAIKANGYKWNPKAKTLEKLAEPKFKVGDKIRHDDRGLIYTIDGIYGSIYGVKELDYGIPIAEQDDLELFTNKFDTNTLKPFDKVLVRDKCSDVWTANFYSHYDATSDRPFVCVGWSEMNEYRYCIPYEANKELLGTTNNIE